MAKQDLSVELTNRQLSDNMTAKTEDYFVDVATDSLSLSTLWRSARFMGRGFSRRMLRRFPNIQVLIVDVDNTLIKGTMAYEVLVDKVGEDEARRIDGEWLKCGLEGDKLLLKGHKNRLEVGITEEDQLLTLERLRKEGRFNDKLFAELHEIKREKIQVIVVTRGSLTVADKLASEYKLDGGYGTVVRDGKIIEMIGAEDGVLDEVTVKSKITKVREHFKQRGMTFDPSRAAHLADDAHDVKEKLQCALGILYVPDGRLTSSQLLSNKLGLYDVRLSQNHVGNLTRLLLDPSNMYRIAFFDRRKHSDQRVSGSETSSSKTNRRLPQKG